MPVPLSIHWIPAHRGSIAGRTDRDWFALWDPAWVKIVTDDETVPYIEDVPHAARIIVRNWPLSELNHQRGLASTGEATLKGSLAAATCDRIARWCEGRGVPRTRLWFEGLNEPMLWSTEPPAHVAVYYRQFLSSLHTFNLRGVVGNFGVGWPGNGGVQDQPVQWDFFKLVIDAMILDPQRPDYLGLHEYWSLNGVGENWRWWAGRYEQCPYNVPLLIVECGIDTGVTGRHYGGWGDLPGTLSARARRYVDELAWYWARCRADGRIQAIFPFTYDRGSDTWVQFDMRVEELLRQITDRQADFPAAQPWAPKPMTVDPLGDTLRNAFGADLVDLRGQLPSNGGYPTRSTATIRRLIVHHTAAPAATSWQSIASYHVNTKGWKGIGYHAGITPDGKLHLLNGIDRISNHAYGHNADSIGIVFAGNFQDDHPTPKALQAYYQYASILDDYLGRVLTWQGHRDVGDTACPGNHLYGYLFDARPDDNPEEAIVAEATARDLYTVNPGAALRRAILADGRVPTSPEFAVTHRGIEYLCQVGRQPGGKGLVYWCERDKWDTVHKRVSHE